MNCNWWEHPCPMDTFLVAFYFLPFLYTIMDKTCFQMKLGQFSPVVPKKRFGYGFIKYVGRVQTIFYGCLCAMYDFQADNRYSDRCSLSKYSLINSVAIGVSELQNSQANQLYCLSLAANFLQNEAILRCLTKRMPCKLN